LNICSFETIYVQWKVLRRYYGLVYKTYTVYIKHILHIVAILVIACQE